MTWSTAEDIAARARRRWNDGSLLRACAANEPLPRTEVLLRGPRAAEIGDRFADVQGWMSDLQTGARDGSRYRLEVVGVGGCLIGRNELPSRAILDSYHQAWTLLRVGGEVARFDEARAAASAEPVVDRWVSQHPLRAVSLAEDMSRIVAAFRWLNDHATKPAFIRIRPDPGLGLLAPASEFALRGDELSQLEIDVNRAGSLPWFRDADITYWVIASDGARSRPPPRPTSGT